MPDFQNIVRKLLSRYGCVEELDPISFFDEVSVPQEIKWAPTYLFRLPNALWAVDIFRGDRQPDVADMSKAREWLPNLEFAFLVPPEEDEGIVEPLSRENGFTLILEIEREWQLVFPTRTGTIVETLKGRYPTSLIRQLELLSNLDPAILEVLQLFVNKYRDISSGPGASDFDEKQEGLIRSLPGDLLRADRRFSACQDPLEYLRVVETGLGEQAIRDHYFHSAHVFLLGCIALDAAYAELEKFANLLLPSHAEFSIEFAWFLTSIYHDTGYAAAHLPEFTREVHGLGNVDISTGERVNADDGQARAVRERYWREEPQLAVCRCQIISMWEHLRSDSTRDDWVPQPLSPDTAHPLDKTLRAAYREGLHGALSATSLALRVGHLVKGRNDRERLFLYRHLYLACLSMLFHDAGVRELASKHGIASIKTSRFPLAALLMFIDAVQDDRRARILDGGYNDVLAGIYCSGNELRAEVETQRLPAPILVRRRKEAKDVLDFLEQDGLRFTYPTEMLPD